MCLEIIYLIYMKVHMELNPTVWRQSKNRIIQIRWIHCDVKSTLNVSVLITFIRTFISWELFTKQWMLVKITTANKMDTTKRYKRAHSVLNLKEISTCLARGMIFENVGFLFLRDKKNPRVFLKKYEEISKFSYKQIVLKLSMLDVV